MRILLFLIKKKQFIDLKADVSKMYRWETNVAECNSKWRIILQIAWRVNLDMTFSRFLINERVSTGHQLISSCSLQTLPSIPVRNSTPSSYGSFSSDSPPPTTEGNGMSTTKLAELCKQQPQVILKLRTPKHGKWSALADRKGSQLWYGIFKGMLMPQIIFWYVKLHVFRISEMCCFIPIPQSIPLKNK